MRFDRLIILLLIAGACKTVSTTSAGAYSEDLSIHRPVMMPKTEEQKPTTSKTAILESTPLTGHIRSELDSIGKVALVENRSGSYVEGFVIQIYSGSSRESANNARMKMYQLFPELEPKVSYHQPNFRVKAGKFTDRLKANRVHKLVKEEFPKALLIPERFLLKYE